MKDTASRLAVTMFLIALSSPAMAQNLDLAKACKPTSTAARCLLKEITALQGQVTTLEGQATTLQGQVTTLQNNDTSLTSQVSTLQTALSTADSDIAALQTALTTVQGNPALALGPYVSVDSGVENGLKGPHVSKAARETPSI